MQLEDLCYMRVLPELSLVLRGAGIGLAGRIGGAGLQLALVVATARLLGASTTGTLFIWFALFQMTKTICTGGFDQAARQFVAKATHPEGVLRTLSRTHLTVIAVGFPLVVLVLWQVSPEYLRTQDSRVPFLIALSAAPFAAIMERYVGALQALRSFGRAAVVMNLCGPLVRLLVFIGLAALGMRVMAAVGALLASSMVAAAFGWGMARGTGSRVGGGHSALSVASVQSRRLLWFAVPTMLASLSVQGGAVFMPLLLGALGTETQVAMLGAAFRLTLPISFANRALADALGPTVARLWDRGDKGNLIRLYSTVTGGVLLVLGLPLVCALLWPEQAMRVFGPEFTTGGGALRVLAIGHLFVLSVGPAGQYLLHVGHPRAHMLTVLIANLGGLALAYALIPAHGSVGAAIGIATGMGLGQVACGTVLLLRLRSAKADLLATEGIRNTFSGEEVGWPNERERSL
jgi:O-antigen/teichoic acid export membrane protein